MIEAQKYWTNKINGFEDISFLSSYGFRGEALSSICAVGELTVITKTSSDPQPTLLR